MADEKVLYEVKDKIAWITLNRPESLNAVNRDMVKAVVGYCREAEEDRDGAGSDIQGQRRAGVFRWRRYQGSGASQQC